MTAINTDFRKTKDYEFQKLIRLIKLSSDENGLVIMKTLQKSIEKATQGYKTEVNIKKPEYTWLNPKL